MAANEEVEFLALVDEVDGILFASGISAAGLEGLGIAGGVSEPASRARSETITAFFPIAINGVATAKVVAGVSADYVGSRLSNIYFDVITVIVVSWFVTIEFIVFFMNTQITTPLKSISMALVFGRNGVFSNRLAVRTRDEVGSCYFRFELTATVTSAPL